jgi:hypothetical protein
MWKKMMLVAGLLGCLTYPLLGGESPAAHNIIPGKPCIPPVVRTLDGKLVYHDGSGPQIPEWEPWIGPGLETGDSWFGLDFREHKELLKQAEKLYGKKVRITGRLEKHTLQGLIRHQIDVLVVTDLQPVEAVPQTVAVEVKGLLKLRIRQCVGTRFSLTTDKGYFGLEFANEELRNLAGRLNGATVIVTGMLAEHTDRGNVITVTGVKIDG